jgi:hypothetical protein
MRARYTTAETYAKRKLTLPRAIRIFVTLVTPAPEHRKDFVRVTLAVAGDRRIVDGLARVSAAVGAV